MFEVLDFELRIVLIVENIARLRMLKYGQNNKNCAVASTPLPYGLISVDVTLKL